MTQIPIQTGTRLARGGFETAFPVNLEHDLESSGISDGQLVTARGAVAFTSGPGVDRGGIMWNGIMYRVMGTKLVSVVGSTVNELGDVGGTDPVRMAYSFDRLAVASNGRLFYWNGATLTEVTDPDLGQAKDLAWIDGYFVTTDGEFLIVTELLDPTQIDPLKYGSAEADPDPVTGVEVLNEELYAIGRHSIQIFRNVGGLGFPFQNIRGATVPYGCIGPSAKCRVLETFAFVGGGREEPLGVFVYANGSAVRISDGEVDDLLEDVPESLIELETRRFGDDVHLVVHTPDASAMMILETSSELGDKIWTILHSGRFGPYRLRHAVWDGVRHVCGDLVSGALGVMTRETAAHFGQVTDWRFDVGLMFNDGRGFIMQEVELFGQYPLDRPSSVFLSVTRDGEVWSNEVARGLLGLRDQRCIWRPGIRVPTALGMRFRGSDAVAIARCEVQGEPLGL
jgi:hypothetical protein